MITLLVEIDATIIRVSKLIHNPPEEMKKFYIHDPSLGTYLDVLVEGSSMADAQQILVDAAKQVAPPALTKEK